MPGTGQTQSPQQHEVSAPDCSAKRVLGCSKFAAHPQNSLDFASFYSLSSRVVSEDITRHSEKPTVQNGEIATEERIRL